MAVDAHDEKNLADDMDEDEDEDEKPIVFKRSSSSTKQSQANSQTKKSSSQKYDLQSGRSAPGEQSHNGQSSPMKKGDVVTPSKAPPAKSPLESLKSSNSFTKTSSVKSSELNLKKPTSLVTDKPKSVKQEVKEENPLTRASGKTNDSEDSEDDKPLSSRPLASSSRVNSNATDKRPKHVTLGQQCGVPKQVYSEDSEDDKPLSSKRLTFSSRVNSNATDKGPKHVTLGQQCGVPKQEDSDEDKPLSSKRLASSSRVDFNATDKGPKHVTLGQQCRVPKQEDSDDELTLSANFRVKPDGAISTSRVCNSDQRNPTLIKINQNGSASTDHSQRKPSHILKKRPQDDVKSEIQSYEKKPKLSDTSMHIKNKQVLARTEPKKEDDDDDDDCRTLASRIMKNQKSLDKKSSAKKVTVTISEKSKKSKKVMKNKNYSVSSKVQPSSGEGQKWTTLVHNGVIFPPPYKPHGVKLVYKGKPVNLTPEQEEVATMYAVMLYTDYVSKPMFRKNFITDWRKILGKNHIIQNLEDCDFTPIYEWHLQEKEKKKQMSADEKKAIKEEKLKQEEKYMWAVVDGVKEKVGNFRVEPPGLFRGRGEHPKMGKLKRRIRPSDIIINIGKDASIPECPIPGESWKEVRHDNTVTWLAYWVDPINPKEFKYIFLAASSTLKGQSDKEKYEKARLLKNHIRGIRAAYTKDFASKDPMKMQRAVATYLIDKLALRAGNEKDDDEADTVGCCTLKVENVEPVPPNILKFDFLGKDSIRYQNEVVVETAVFKAIQQFRKGKKEGDDLFEELDTSKLNAHLKELMPGLTAKVFRTYNASITLDDMLSRETKDGDLPEKIVTYQHANKEVAIICNHQRTVSKSHSAQMLRLGEKIEELKAVMEELNKDLARAKKGKPPLNSSDGKTKKNMNPEVLEKKIAQNAAKIEKMERDKETKEDLKTVALGTSKINYLDPRITVAWCKRHEVPIEKIFNKSLIAKFAWAMDVDPEFRF